MTSHPGVTGRKVFANSALYADAQITLAFGFSPATLRNWRLLLGFPAGSLFGRLRRTAGADLNAWIEANASDAKVQLPRGMGESPHRGRPRKRRRVTQAEAAGP
jgi:hypothetical protein